MCNVHSVVQYKMCDAHYKLREFYTHKIHYALHMALDVKEMVKLVWLSLV